MSEGRVTAMRTRILGTALIVLFVVLASGKAQTPPESEAKPISQPGLTKALQIGGVPTAELIQIIEKRGVAFQLTDEIERDLRAAGATPELLATVRANYRPPASATAAPSIAPLSKSEITTLLSAGVATTRVEQIVRERGVSFTLTPDVAQELKVAGADERLLAAISAVSSKPDSARGASTPRPVSGLRLSSLKEVHKLFIEKMENNLDEYLRAEFSKQMPGRFLIVLNAEEADALMVGSSEQKTGTGAMVTGRYLGLHDVATGAISIVDKAGTVLWAGEAGDRSLLLGPVKRGGARKVADRLVHSLKKAME
jgi:hypothetical protein